MTERNCTAAEKAAANLANKTCTVAYDVDKECDFSTSNHGTVDKQKLVGLMENQGTQMECAIL